MSFNGAGLGMDVFGNTVSGAGLTSLIAQSGIQLGSGATGSIHNNIISGNQYSNPSAALASGILVNSAGLGASVTGNTFSGSNRAIYVTGSVGVIIDGNDVSGTDETGIFAFGGDATINNNNVHNNSGDGVSIQQGTFTITNNSLLTNVASGLRVRGDSDPAVVNPIAGTISNNFISGNHDGIFIDATVDGAASLVIHRNSNHDNSDAGLDNESADRVNASENWWGTINGPADPANGFNVGAQGNAVKGNAAFMPWLASGEDTQPAVAGFQPGSAVFGRITNDTGGAFSTIQSAIDSTAPGGTITLADGVYNESNIHVNKPLTIQGADAGSVILGPSIADDHTDSAFGGSVSNAF